jgi:hypothetical protein
VQAFAGRREMQQTRTSVITIYATGEQTVGVEAIDEQTCAVAIYTKPVAKAALINTGFFIDIAQHGKFKRCQVVASEGLH